MPRTKPRASALTPKDIKDALLRSGYLLEGRIADRMRARGYYVEESASYPDPDTGKSRELDAYGLSAVCALEQTMDFAFAALLVEGINNPQPLALLSKGVDVPLLYRDDLHVAGLPAIVPQPKGRRWVSIRDALQLESFHHYCRGAYATQFCSFQQKKNASEWMAWHDDTHFESIKKLGDAVLFFRDGIFRGWHPGGVEKINLELYYPVLVLQGALLDVRRTTRGLQIRPITHGRLRRTAIHGGETFSYQIDVVVESYLPELLKTVAREGRRIERYVQAHRIRLRHACKLIAQRAMRMRGADRLARAVRDLGRAG